MNFANYFSFVTAAVILALIPGPGILFVLAQTSKGGRSAGVSAAAGTAIGGMIHVLAAAVGLSALIYSSAVAFSIVKTLGALYLFFLGYKALKEKRDFSLATLSAIKFENESLKQGIMTEALNPKTALFFLALIPQFVQPNSNVAYQFVLLGTTSVFLNTSVDLLVVFSANILISYLRRSNFASNSFKYASAAGYVALGALALRTSKEAA